MTNRERFRLTMEGKAVDRCPVIEWAMWWDKTIRCWEKEKMPKRMKSMELFDYFGLDRHCQFWFAHRKRNCPKPKYHGAPLIKDAEDYKNIKKYIYPKNAVKRVLAKFEENRANIENGETICWYTLEGFFWFPRTLLGIEGHLYSFYDMPELYHAICEDLLEWHLTVIEEFSRLTDADFMTFAEDMSYNLGPMISEECFDEFVAPYYRRLIPEIKKRGVKVIVDSDGDISSAVPWFIGAGIEGILPLERQAGVDIPELQKKYPDFIWLGGFDKMCLLRGKAAIDAEFERLRPAIKNGRFIPSVDHQTPPGVTIEDYRYYVAKLGQYAGLACKK